jgi:antitoxin (DNA-binding transcriptional repressor) of toxin-antitoxin stability system
MAAKTVTATEVVRNFSDIINQVRYQSAEFEIVRGKEVVARLVPPAPPGGVPLDKLGELISALPRLGRREADALARDIARGLSRMRTDVVEWD